MEMVGELRPSLFFGIRNLSHWLDHQGCKIRLQITEGVIICEKSYPTVAEIDLIVKAPVKLHKLCIAASTLIIYPLAAEK